jgi:TRAP-type C4-dicarboxylate transport system permease small subunit
MLPEKKTNTNIGVGIGLLLQVIGRVLAAFVGGPVGILGVILALAGLILFIWGCMNYAEGKGYSKWLGLLGLLSCIGLLVLVVLPDKNKTV